jgi:hypothetical protein
MLFSCATLVQAEDMPGEEAQSFYSYGEVLSVSADQILIKEFDYVTGDEKEAVYHIDKETSFDSVESAQQIAPGELVDIEFIVSEDGRNIARDIFVDRIEDFENFEED